MKLIQNALARGQTSLNEHDSKLVCASLGIPVCREVIAGGADEAAAEAEKIGFPVVLKAVGEKLLHKTEAGAVALNLTDAAMVRREGRRLRQIRGSEALLLQEMVPGSRELVCGLVRDDHFGPCVMFGLGGVLTEVFQDVVFRVVPLRERDAREMVSELRHHKILKPFRGEAAVDLDELVRVLLALGDTARRYPEVQSVDINPLKIRPDGAPVAVDALVTLAPDRPSGNSPAANPVEKESLKRFFEPESVAVIGASAARGKAGNTVVRNILANGYTGKLYLVNPKGGEIEGITAYTSIDSLPEGVAQAIIMTPARTTVQAVRDCATRGIRYIVLAAGGFSEVDEEGDNLQQELSRAIAETGVRAIGPNTSGHTSTPYHFTSGFFPLGKIPRGNISYIAQTGNFATHTMRYIATGENFGVARVMGLGNKIDVDESEVLEYYAEDPETKAIFMYLEAIKRPERFLEVAGEVTRTKPVFMLKGGSTGEGSRAAMTHTAALASDERVIDGAIAQAGITRLYDYSHLFLVAKAISFMPLPQGNRVSFLAPSGAMLVVLADLCYQRWGLTVPDLEEGTRQRLQEISPPFIRMRNPVDIWPSALAHSIEFSYREGIEALMRDANIDAIVPIMMLTDAVGVPPLDFLVELAENYPEKLLYVTFSGEKHHMEAAKAFLEPRGVPTFPLIEEPFEVLSMLNRCRQAMTRPR